MKNVFWYLGPLHGDDGFLVDPIEGIPRIRKLVRQAEREAVELVDYPEHQMGYSGAVSSTTQEILKEKHGIAWLTPEEMNSNVIFD